jgi:hypothetical protein
MGAFGVWGEDMLLKIWILTFKEASFKFGWNFTINYDKN